MSADYVEQLIIEFCECLSEKRDCYCYCYCYCRGFIESVDVCMLLTGFILSGGDFEYIAIRNEDTEH